MAMYAHDKPDCYVSYRGARMHVCVYVCVYVCVCMCTSRYGESVGDLDVVDGAPRSVTCIALDEGCTVVQLPRALFMAFVHAHPQVTFLTHTWTHGHPHTHARAHTSVNTTCRLHMELSLEH